MEPELEATVAALEASRPHDFFPFEEIRPVQIKAMDSWMKAMDKEKRYVVAELPPGSGKSPIACAIGSWAKNMTGLDEKTQPGAYILTTQKSLQQQYLRDFSRLGLLELKGAGNYACNTHNTDCRTGGMLNNANKALIADLDPDDPETDRMRNTHPTGCDCCPYKEAKANFIASRLGVTNFSYMLTETVHVGLLRPRSLLIIDEAHNTESQLLSFVEIEITAKRCEEVDCGRPPAINVGDIITARDWILEKFMPRLESLISKLQEQGKEETVSEIRRRTLAKAAAASQFMSRLKFLENTEDLSDWFAYTDEKTYALKIRPLTARTIAQDFLFRMGHKMLFLSATILDGKSFIRGLGLLGPEGAFLRVDSDFPVQNRLINIWPAGSMSFKNKEATIPRLVRYVEKICDKHGDEKGLIHTHSYALTGAIVEHLQNTKHASRLIYHDSIPGSRDAAILKHISTEDPTILISPSMTEGLDLSEELSRWQIISKIPYPFWGDPFIRARAAHDPDWMTWQTALTLVQASGRSIRSRDDHATTYILDSDAETFLGKADSILPDWWKRALVFR